MVQREPDVDSQAVAPLWSRNLWMICCANLFVSASLYMLIPTLPVWLMQRFGLEGWEAGGVLALAGLSCFIPGPFFNYLVDRYRRRSVCLWAILSGVVLTAGYYWVSAWMLIPVLRVLQGMAQGVALMAGGSTLAIDLTASPRRTDANHAFAWFGRLGLSLGPLFGLLLVHYADFRTLLLVSCVLGLAGAFCVSMLNVPFRAPLRPAVCSLDRFWLSGSWLMFFQVLLLSIGVGILLSSVHRYEFYAFLMVGFCLSMLAFRFVFQEADLRAEMVSGLILWGAGLLVRFFYNDDSSVYASGILVGLGMGLSSARLLISYIKLSRHCERGAANTSFLLAWESGLSLGCLVGYAWMGTKASIAALCLCLLAVLLVLYLGVGHRWFMRHKVR